MRRNALWLITAGLLVVPGTKAGGEGTIKKGNPESTKVTVKRLDDATDEDLRKQLLRVPEAALDPRTGSSNTVIITAARALADKQSGLDGATRANLTLSLAPLLMSRRRDLAGLRIHTGQDCRLGKEAAETLQALSRKLRVHLEASIPPRSANDPRPDPKVLRSKLLEDPKQKEWLQPEAIPALQQLLMAENKPVRVLMVELLSKIKDKRATVALVQRALFDLHPEVREAAVKALNSRPRKDYAVWLTQALRYPWPPVVNHAAEALVSLRLKETARNLVSLLKEPDPSQPLESKLGKKKVRLVRELVRVNHLNNCLLCHAQSLSRTDLVRGAVPTPGEPLPAPVTTPAYYDRGGTFVRADVTYLKQDFSVFQSVPNPGKWPAHQRYDYLVRVRPITKAEFNALSPIQTFTKTKSLTPQKKAILYALRELTGKDLGTSVKAWQKLFPDAEMKSGPRDRCEIDPFVREVARLTSDLVMGSPNVRAKLLRQYRDSKGLVYTEALASAIPYLAKPLQRKAREALADRLTRMSAATLSDKLRDESTEVRRAAILACLKKNLKSHIPEIIPLLGDSVPVVSRVALSTLRRMTGENFGPSPRASKEERAAAIAKWKAWWKRARKK
jgi:hypothetical protein